MTDVSAVRHLRASFRAALRLARQRRSQLFVELFSGAGGITRAWRRAGFGAMAFDINLGDFCDLTRPRVVRLIEGWLRAGCIMGVWLGTPCTSWSRARRGPANSNWCSLRSDHHIRGLPGLSEPNRERVKVGNATAAVSARIVRLCLSLRVPCAVENPLTSRLWVSPYFARLLGHASCRSYRADFCQFGARWRKATKVATWCCLERSLDCRCTGRHGLCSLSGRHHIVLTGSDPVSKRLWTNIAQEYPRRFCEVFAKLVSDSADHAALRNRTRVACC